MSIAKGEVVSKTVTGGVLLKKGVLKHFKNTYFEEHPRTAASVVCIFYRSLQALTLFHILRTQMYKF